MSVLKRILGKKKEQSRARSGAPPEEKSQELAARSRQASSRLRRLQLQEDLISRKFTEGDRRAQ